MEDFIQIVKKTNPEARIKIKDGNLHLKGDIYIWQLLDKVMLPDNLKVDGYLCFGDDCVDVLPKGLEVEGLFIYLFSGISEVPADLKAHTLCLSGTQIKKLPENMNYFKGSLNLRFLKIKKLPPNLTVDGDLNVMHTSLKELPKNLKVGNTLTISDSRLLDNTIGLKTKNLSFTYSNIKSLSFALKLRGTLDLSDSEIECLPDNMRIGGDLILKNCKNIKSLPKGLYIGGTLDISNSEIKTLPDDIIVRNKKKKGPDYSGLGDHKYKEEDIKLARKFREKISKETDPKVLEKLYRGFIQDYPNNPCAYEELMSFYYFSGKYEKVEAIYKKACIKYLVSPAMQYIIGCSYYKKQDFKISYYYAKFLFDTYQLREQSSILLFNTLYCLLKSNTEEQYSISKKLFEKMKDVERYHFKSIERTDDMEYYRKLLKAIKIDLTENKKLTKKYNIFELM